MNELIKKVEAWGEEKGIVDPSNTDKQFMKFMEEVFEFKTLLDLEIINFVGNGGYIKFDDTKMEFGDVLVTLVILAKQLGLDWEECLSMAYEKNQGSQGQDHRRRLRERGGLSMIQRNLDGVYFRVERYGKWVSRCFSDLTEDEMHQVMDGRPIAWVQSLCVILGQSIRGIGDALDLYNGEGDAE